MNSPFRFPRLCGARQPAAGRWSVAGTASAWRWTVALTFWALTGPAHGQFNPARVKAEPPAVASRFPDPPVPYQTPGLLAGRTDFPGHAEVLAFLQSLAAQSRQVSVTVLGQSQQGLDIPLVVLSSARGFQSDRPTVMIVGQQHGNEPAGGEAALALAQQLIGPESALLEGVNVLILPRANPDGAQNFVRATASGLDVNRDHLLLQTPEGRAVAATALRYRPQVVLDLHEFTVGDRWLDKFAAYAKYDALLQASTVGNMDPDLAGLALREFVGAARTALQSQGLSTFWYHTSSPDPADKVVSMGGVQPDTGRNVFGLRNAISLLIETRGVGVGRAHFARRVHTHVLASLAVLRSTAARSRQLMEAVEAADAATVARACKGEIVVRARPTRTQETLTLVDAVSGADRSEVVDWLSALSLDVTAARARPCGYWLAPGQEDVVARLQALGIKVGAQVRQRRAVVEQYRIVSERGGQRLDARGAIAASRAIRDLTIALDRSDGMLPAAGWWVGLDQPLAHLAVAALEPDSQNSFVANHVMELGQRSVLRVMGWVE